MSAPATERTQYDVLDRYAASAQAALHLDGLALFRYGGLEMEEALGALQSSLEQIVKKGELRVAQASNGCNAESPCSMNKERGRRLLLRSA